jgi:hypothetical protein
MKKKIVIVTLMMLTLNATTAPKAEAQNCQSLLQVVGKVWKKWGEVIIATGCVAGTTIATGGIGIGASLECVRNADKYKKATEKMLTLFNDLADNGPATIGPRRIEFGRTQSGTVLGPGDRTYVSVYPMDKDRVTIKLKKLDGLCRTEVIICKIDANEKVTNLAVFEFDKDDPDGKEITKTLTGVQNHLIQVRINGITLTRKFQYQFLATK